MTPGAVADTSSLPRAVKIAARADDIPWRRVRGPGRDHARDGSASHRARKKEWRRTRGGESGVRAQLESFGYLGAAALALVAAAVLVLGLAGVSGGRPEQLGMIGMFAFVLYLGIAYVVAHLLAHRR